MRTVPTAYPYWELTEGGSGVFTTYLALWNPNHAAATVRVHYRHESGTISSQDVVLAPLARAVLGTPSWVAAGGYGLQLWSLSGHAFVAERMVYAGPTWEIGHASPGARAVGTRWHIAEGSSAGTFETYFLLTNTAGPPATVTLTYRSPAGSVIGTDTLVISPYGRGKVWANGTTGAQDFTTEVTSTQPIMAERAIYWPTGSSSLQAGGEALTDAADSGAKAPAAPDGGPSPYTLTEGTQGPTIEGDATTKEVVVGKRSPSSRTLTEGATTQSSSGLPWYGSHLTVGKRP